TVSKVPNTKDTIKFKPDSYEIIYIMDMFHDTLHLPVETLDNLFIAPVTIKYPYFTKLIIAHLMKKYSSIPQRLNEDYHSIKDDIPLVVEGDKDKESYADKFAASMLHDDVDDSKNMIEPESHKEHLEVVGDDDENEEEKKDEKKDDEMSILENKTEKIATNDLIEENLKRVVADTVIQERDAFQSKMKSSLQDQANDPALWDVLKHKFEKSFTSTKESTTYVTNQQQQQEWDAWEEETVVDEDVVIPKDETRLITEFQNVDKRVPTIFDHARMKATLNDMLSNQFRNAEEYANHLEQATNFMEN
nr:hypothetical protein [Tanacetum cinerariifolium]